MADNVVYGELVGHRAWRVTVMRHLRFYGYPRDWRSARLRSSFVELNWQPHETMTMDTAFHRGATIYYPLRGDARFCPLDAGYGIHAFKTADELRKEGRSIPSFPQVSIWYVTGTVWMWGRVMEHTRGYRSEFAKIRSINGVTKAMQTNPPPFDLFVEYNELYDISRRLSSRKLISTLQTTYGVTACPFSSSK